MLITAHGISDAERRRLTHAGKQLIDTTCPLVTRVHRAAQALQKQGYYILVLGRRSYVEVRGIVGDLACRAVDREGEQLGGVRGGALGLSECRGEAQRGGRDQAFAARGASGDVARGTADGRARMSHGKRRGSMRIEEVMITIIN